MGGEGMRFQIERVGAMSKRERGRGEMEMGYEELDSEGGDNEEEEIVRCVIERGRE